MVRVKLVPKRVTVPRRIRQFPPREPYQKFKIKLISRTKNRQVVRTVTVRRKTKRFTDRWAKTF